MQNTLISIISLGLFLGGCASPTTTTDTMSKLEIDVGRALYFDKALSQNGTQACATCHNPDHGFVDNRDNGVEGMASLGDDGISLGDRQAPSAAYAAFSPLFHYDAKEDLYIGGQFWDGREATLAGQAGGPPTNPIEMAMPDKQSVIERLKANPYYVESFIKLYGPEIFSHTDTAYVHMTKAIEAFEKTDFFAPFDSKYDRYLKGEYALTPLEDLGRSLFFSNNNSNCATCHMLKKEDAKEETFSNYEFHNIGVPPNKALRSKNGVSQEHVDEGLLANSSVTDVKHKGKYKVPTLRNVAITAPYMHNGVFKELRTVVEFYDHYNNPDRSHNPESGKPWERAEVEETINKEELKAKKLTDRKVDALVAFMKLLTDRRYEHLLER